MAHYGSATATTQSYSNPHQQQLRFLTCNSSPAQAEPHNNIAFCTRARKTLAISQWRIWMPAAHSMYPPRRRRTSVQNCTLSSVCSRRATVLAAAAAADPGATAKGKTEDLAMEEVKANGRLTMQVSDSRGDEEMKKMDYNWLTEPQEEDKEALSSSSSYTQWDSLTGQLAGSATLAFLLLQMPQIFLNAQNLINGNTTALFAVPWMGQLTGLLGNLSLLSYFAKKRERGAMVVQAVGVISTLVVLLQLTMARSMPSTVFMVTATAVGIGLALNFLNYKSLLSQGIWRTWEDVITIGGLSVLPQVMWSTFEPVLPPSTLPGIVALIVAFSLVILGRLEKLPPNLANLMGAVSAWTATLLFMWAPVAQMWTNFLNPANIRGLSVFTVILAMVGNGLLLPRALFTRDAMWFTGSSWGTLLQGWGILVTMYINKCIDDMVFWGASGVLAVWLATILWKDSKAYSLRSPLSPLSELVSNRRARGPLKLE